MKPSIKGRSTVCIRSRPHFMMGPIEQKLHLKIYTLGDLPKDFDTAKYFLGLTKNYHFHDKGEYGIAFIYTKDQGVVCSDIVLYHGKLDDLLNNEYPKMETISVDNGNIVKEKENSDLNELELAVLNAEENYRKLCKEPESILKNFPDMGSLLAKE